MSDSFIPTPQQQQIFVLSMLANEAGACQWSPQTLQTNLNICTTTTPTFGAWELVWGPYYYYPSPASGSTPVVANTVYVAQQAQNNTYVVAIAGTNVHSGFDWMTEDVDITPISWPYVPSAGLVTQGDAAGVAVLLGTSFPQVSPPSTSTLLPFLQALPNKSDISLVITGHSLGGALAPLLALAILDPRSSVNTTAGMTSIDASQWQQVYMMATAGPSPADANLVHYLNQTISNANQGKSSPQWRNDFIWNALDIVPHVWEADTFSQISTLYNTVELSPGSCIAKTIQNLQTKVNNTPANYTLFQPDSSFSGGLQPYVFGFWTMESKYLAQVVYQHVQAYMKEFGCTWLSSTQLTDTCRQLRGDICNEPLIADALLIELNRKLCG